MNIPTTIEALDLSSTIIQVENLSLHYNRKPAFAEVSLPIYRDQITSLIGPSGCGKTSFLMCLNRLVDLVPLAKMSGQIRFNAEDIAQKKVNVVALRRKIGMIFQRPNPFPLSIKKNLELPLKEHRTKNKAEIEEIIQTTLEAVGLWKEVKDRLRHSALLLSGGQQQRLCIARALVLEPELLLMDEPCSALDPLSSATVEELIQQLKEKCSLLIVTHNLAQARRIADYTALFWFAEQTGKLIEYGPSAEIFNQPKNQITEAYIRGERG